MNNEKLCCIKCNAKRPNLDLRGVWARCWVCGNTFKIPQEYL